MPNPGKLFEFCTKFPWSTNPKTPVPETTCQMDTPFLFKSAKTITSIALNALSSLPNQLGLNPENTKNMKEKKKLSSWEQAEAEQRAFASALVCGKDCTVVEFYSPNCNLCNSLVPFVGEVESRNSDWLNVVMADAENQEWLPELLHYDIKYVPCFVLVDNKNGQALAKTGVPNSRHHVIAGVSHLLKMRSPHKK